MPHSPQPSSPPQWSASFQAVRRTSIGKWALTEAPETIILSKNTLKKMLEIIILSNLRERPSSTLREYTGSHNRNMTASKTYQHWNQSQEMYHSTARDSALGDTYVKVRSKKQKKEKKGIGKAKEQKSKEQKVKKSNKNARNLLRNNKTQRKSKMMKKKKVKKTPETCLCKTQKNKGLSFVPLLPLASLP